MRRYSQQVLTLRALLFYAVYGIVTALLGLFTLMICTWLPYRQRAPLILLWNRFALAWARLACGIEWRVIGLDNIPSGPAVYLSKHESPWETIFLQWTLRPVATVLKQELLNTPVFGWGLRLMKPIAIDRGSPREALKKMLAQGVERLGEGLSVLVFPEGTRTQAGATGRFAKGGANIAVHAGVPVVPIAHDAGSFWPPHRLAKQPGVITVVIGPAIDTRDRRAADINTQVERWITEQVETLNQARSN